MRNEVLNLKLSSRVGLSSEKTKNKQLGVVSSLVHVDGGEDHFAACKEVVSSSVKSRRFLK